MSRISKKWTEDEDELLIEMYNNGSDIYGISNVLRRYPKGIAYRVVHHSQYTNVTDHTKARGWQSDEYRPESLVELRDQEIELAIEKQRLIKEHRRLSRERRQNERQLLQPKVPEVAKVPLCKKIVKKRRPRIKYDKSALTSDNWPIGNHPSPILQ